MDWNNIDLNNKYERDQNILDPYSFDTLLLEISCNIKDITRISVLTQFEKELKIKIGSAREIMLSNIDNIVNQAQKERE